MSEFERFIDAAKHGAVEEVQAMIHNHAEFVLKKDQSGATALHHAAFGGHRSVAQLLVAHGADINATDDQFGATPSGWAIEYLREMGGFLAIELNDFAFAIQRADIAWIERLLKRFPGLRGAKDTQGNSFELLAEQTGNPEVVSLFA